MTKVVVGQALRWNGNPLAAGAFEAGVGLVEKFLPGKSVTDADDRILAGFSSHELGYDPKELRQRADFQDADRAAAKALDRKPIDPLALAADLEATKRQLSPGVAEVRATLQSPDAQKFFDLFIDAGLHVLRDTAIASKDFLARATTRSLANQAKLAKDAADLRSGIEDLPNRIGLVNAQPHVDRYLATVKALAISDPDREADRQRAREFAVQSERRWLWWRAAPWAGKTTLMADLACSPPEGAEVAVFLTIGRDEDLNNRAGFYTRMLPQLAILAGERTVDLSATDLALRSDQFTRLLTEAGDNCLRKGKRLLLLIDGLDEDRLNNGSIAAAMPATLPDGVNVLVTSRSNPRLHVPYDHPLAADRWAEPLAAAPAAVARRQQAEDELGRLWRYAGGLGRSVLCFAAAAGAPLTAVDLAELCSQSSIPADHFVVQGLLDDHAARVLHGVPLRRGEIGYQVGHAVLDEWIIRALRPRLPANLGPEDRVAWDKARSEALTPWREHIHEWIAGFAAAGWPDETPQYAGEPYFSLLETTGDRDRMVAMAIDRDRHEFLYRATSGNLATYKEIDRTVDILAGSDAPSSLAEMLELAVLRDSISTQGAVKVVF
ncbi:hypothetical protein [Tessaracoccus caeni]|uniref:hypothetical protein n=1 Tax=Tessaracoccus caeni TaxID=3031239 RepID=UPI0023DCE5F0|nr:hypothetical protein [Tessaracoccus caeni]MDF1488700.1 hypothetical protein [Tessaracoccus caeni]